MWNKLIQSKIFFDKLPDEVKGSAWRAKQDRRKARRAERKKLAATSKPKPKNEKFSKSKAGRTGFYASDAWLALRYKALKQHGGCCQCCGNRGTPGHPVHVDHIKPRSKFPELQLRLDNLQVLCEDCNMGKSNRDDTDWRPPA